MEGIVLFIIFGVLGRTNKVFKEVNLGPFLDVRPPILHRQAGEDKAACNLPHMSLEYVCRSRSLF